jgi:hypothetical protein
MANSVALLNLPLPSLLDHADKACRAIPPVWPLASSVAVNPYLGQTGQTLAEVGARLARVGGVRVTPPRGWYAAKIEAGAITEADLAAAIAVTPGAGRLTPAALRAKVVEEAAAPCALPTIADLAAAASGTDWPGIIAERIGAWAGGYFDQGQALWAAPRGQSLWRAWREAATHDLTPEIMGVGGFARKAHDAPDAAEGFLASAVGRLGLPAEALETYWRQLLMSLGGWAHVGRYSLWMAELRGGQDQGLTDLLAVRLFWEVALFDQYAVQIGTGWEAVKAGHAAPLEVSADLTVDAVLQEAAERANQRDLAALLSPPGLPEEGLERPTLQAAFCIDVRSEVFRRALELQSPEIETLGFAGFFGLGASHRGYGSDVDELRLPVLLNPGVHSCSGGHAHGVKDQEARFAARAARAWGRFKLAAVSSFAFVESAGPLYAGKLARDSLGLKKRHGAVEPAPQLHPPLDLSARLNAAATILGAMSLTKGFARIVLLAGHGANVVNNPHASALHCGACGGYSGEVNARLLAGLLNAQDVREGLAAKGVIIPPDTVFIGALHDTTTDEITLYTDDQDVSQHTEDLRKVRAWLDAAGRLCRGERAKRLPRAKGADGIDQRSRDWAEVRPEWALAGCAAFIAAPRSRTAGRSLSGRAFLHTYAWREDEDFKVLELIMTAPVVVASWISLQYYGSVVAPETFGGGNKLLHNVVGGVGVLEGNGGPLRVGLPWQSVHDGEKPAHDPLRLSVCIEAPREAITAILEAHPGVRALFDQRWLHLFAMDDDGRLAWRYGGDLQWTPMEAEGAPRREAALATG